MSPTRLFAIFLILAATSFGWVVLGGSIQYRTDDAGDKGWERVGTLWGQPQMQTAPTFRTGQRPVEVVSSDVSAAFDLEQRKKGLLWYATYVVDFDAAYGLHNDGTASLPVTMAFAFPTPDGVYDGFAVHVDGREAPVTYESGIAKAQFEVAPGATAEVRTGYRTQGQDEWRYQPTDGVGVVKGFALSMSTDFTDIDFPTDAVSPTAKRRTDTGWDLSWDYESLVTGRPIGIAMPTPLNPGPTASRISFFAPVSLLFYFAALVLLTATRRVSVHPMNYAFLAAGFFAFHLLFAYLVDRIDLTLAFVVASAVSVALCVGYLRLVLADRRALGEAAVGQLIFLVLFSFSFFFEGYTGLAVTIGAVLTLAYFMARTGRLDWDEVFARGARERQARRGSPWSAAQPGSGTPPTASPGGHEGGAPGT